jgi:ribosomal RNA assembly protein
MKKILIEKISRITKNKKKLEEKLGVKIINRGKEFFIEGKAEDEYLTEKILEALNFGFPFLVALLIKEENYEFEILNIKDYTNRKDFKIIRGRLIGKQGKSFKTISSLTNCYFELKDNRIGIIGRAELIKNAQDAIIGIIQGSKHSNIYKKLEKNKSKPIEDLGLKG